MNGTRSPLGRRLVNLTVLGLAAVLTAGLAGSASGIEAITTKPGDTIGGPLHAEMYPSGVATAPDGTVVIADTGNNRIARYREDGTVVWSVGTFGAGTLQFDNPRDVAVDAQNNVYVADTRNSRIVKLSPSGEWLAETRGPSTSFSFQLGVSVVGKHVYVGDTGRSRVVVLDRGLDVERIVLANGDCSTIGGNRDATADSDGNIYVAGYKTNEVLKFSPDGTCLKTWGGTGTTAGKFRTPYGVDVAFDPVADRELVYVADGLNNRVQVFTTSGTFVTEFGGFGEPDQEGTFTTMRRVSVAQDGSGDVWAADLWGDRVERWRRTQNGFVYAATIGAVMPAPTSTRIFHEPRGMAFTPGGNLWVTDTVHHEFARFNDDGDLLGTCGMRAAEGSRLGQFNWPRGLAVDPATGNLWIADTKQHQLQVLTPSCAGIGFVKNVPAGGDTRSFNWPHDIAIRDSDRFAFVVDTQNHRIKAYDVAHAVFPVDNKGPLPAYVFGSRGTGARNFMFPSGVAVGPDGHVFVADRGNNRIQELSFTAAAGFTVVRSWKAGGTLDGPEGVAVDATGRVIVADSNDDQVVVLAAGAGVQATINGLSHPAAVEVAPDGLVLVSDTYADVVRTYRLGASASDSAPPTGTVAEPAVSAAVPPPVKLAGTAADDTGVAAVRLGIRQNATGLYWNGTDWQSTAVKVSATLANQDGTSTTWSYVLDSSAPGAYGFSTDITDVAGNSASGTDTPLWRSFGVTG